MMLLLSNLITHRAIRQAEASGSLNTLNSVYTYTKEPKISAKVLRASARSMAALE